MATQGIILQIANMMPVSTLMRLFAVTGMAALLCSCNHSEPCTVRFEQAPELRGFRLGMSISDIQSRFPGFPAPAVDDVGLSIVEISNQYSSDLVLRSGTNVVNGERYSELNKLRYVKLKLLDGKVVEIAVYYPNDLNWKSADEFAQKTGEALKLNGSWKTAGTDDDFSATRYLSCGEIKDGFNVSAGMRRSPLVGEYEKLPYVQLQDFWRAEIELSQRQKDRDEKRKRAEQERKETFKP